MGIDLNLRWRPGFRVLGLTMAHVQRPQSASAREFVRLSDAAIQRAYEAEPKVKVKPHDWDPHQRWDPCMYLLGGEPVDSLSIPQVLELLDVTAAVISNIMSARKQLVKGADGKWHLMNKRGDRK